MQRRPATAERRLAHRVSRKPTGRKPPNAVVDPCRVNGLEADLPRGPQRVASSPGLTKTSYRFAVRARAFDLNFEFNE